MDAEWLASLGGVDDDSSDDDAAVEGEVGKQDACEDEESRALAAYGDTATVLKSMGFLKPDILFALQESDGNLDEALLVLRKRCKEVESEDEDEEPASKKPRRVLEVPNMTPCGKSIVEIEGFPCVEETNGDLSLWLPRINEIGPIVGKNDGDAIDFSLDEWVHELYEAEPPRADVEVVSKFDAGKVVDTFQSGSPFVWSDFASKDEVRDAWNELEKLHAKGALSGSRADTTADVKLRSDQVLFVDLHGGKPNCPAGCLKLFHRLEASARLLQESNWPSKRMLLCPRFGMATVYDGKGSLYTAHRDNERLPCNNSSSSSSQQKNEQWINYRELTTIAYINSEGTFEKVEDGGRLRCHIGADQSDQTGETATRIDEVAPLGGSAVLFPSRDILHEVLPTYARRYALTMWFLAIPAN